jgi:hypothetical protein
VILYATAGRANVALCFRYRDRDELARWESLTLVGHTLELTDTGDGGDRAPV